jgi:flagellar biogenesis protein FliO
MVDSLFGVELPLPVKLIVAFVVVLALIGLATWALRRIGGNRLGTPTTRGRQPRLAVIDAAAVDGRRRLVLIRRDNVEHLLMIGGPTDVVVEQNIVRAVPVTLPREAPPPRGAGAEPLRAQAEPLPRSAAEGARPVSSPDIAPRGQARSDPTGRPPRSLEPRRLPNEGSREPLRPPRPQPTRGEPEPTVEVHAAPPTADANLSDMAQRLEAALRRQPSAAREPAPFRDNPRPSRDPQAAEAAPTGTLPEVPSSSARPEGTAAPQPNADAASAARNQAPQTKPARTEPKPAQQKSVIDSLEEEMASLLGRPPGKE